MQWAILSSAKNTRFLPSSMLRHCAQVAFGFDILFPWDHKSSGIIMVSILLTLKREGIRNTG